ncbi:MAG: L,D-transpeptidase, partial [Thermomicrobiales bacterium]
EDGDAGEDGDAERIVQYFEGAALIYLPERAPGEQVATLPIGEAAAEILSKKYPEEFARADDDACGSMDEVDCVRFDETGHSLHTGFKAFWEQRSGADLLGMPVSEEFRALDGREVQFFERGALQWKSGEDITVRPIGRELAAHGDLDTRRIDRPAGVPAYDESLFIAPEPVLAEVEPAADVAVETAVGADGFGPGPVQGGWKEIVISISSQRLWAYEDGEMILTTLVSTGTAEIPFTVTPVGRWSVLSKYDLQTMRGTVSGEDYEVPDVPWIMYFDNLGNALHGTYWHSNFGTPMSHGCVNLPLDVAEFLYGWTPLGTQVTVVE